MVELMPYSGRLLMILLVLLSPVALLNGYGYQNDLQFQDMISKLAIQFDSMPHFSLSAGILIYKSRIWVGANVPLQLKLMHACHASALGGHSGLPITYMRMKQILLGRA